jgi:SHS2 domain-containing protein
VTNFEQFEHEADVGVRGYGKTIEEAFQNGAKAMFDIMANLGKVDSINEFRIRCEASDLEELFVEWLNALLSQAGVKTMIFSEFKVEKISKTDRGYELIGLAKGEKLNPEKHETKIEVKAAT